MIFYSIYVSSNGLQSTQWIHASKKVEEYGPFTVDATLKAELVYKGLKRPTSMAFLGPDDILVLEKNIGTVQRVINGEKLRKAVFDTNVANGDGSGMLGIAIQKNISSGYFGINKESIYVFLYFTVADKDGGEGLGNRLYRYELVNNKLVNPKLFLDVPAGYFHNGGTILIGPDKYLYIVIGDLDIYSHFHETNKAINYQGNGGNETDGRAGILRIDQNGEPIGTRGILGDKEPLNKYYSYGIRNSFGMDFDPLTGKLWDTENGPEWGDEINLVDPGFNSGWNKVQGIWTVDGGTEGEEGKGTLANEKVHNLVNFDGKGKYSSPDLTWDGSVGPSALKFLSTDKLGKKYENDMLVAELRNDRIYHFELSENRTALSLQGPLIDKVVDSDNELDSAIFAGGFGLITDLEIGPDGYLYVLDHKYGRIFRIVPK